MLSTLVITLALLHTTVLASSKIEKAPGFIYIASFNVYRLGAVESRYKTVSELNNEIPTRIKNIARVLAVGDFDIIALQEVRAGQSGQAVDSVAEKQIMALPPQTPRPTSDVDTQRRFDEFQREIRGEFLNYRGKSIERCRGLKSKCRAQQVELFVTIGERDCRWMDSDNPYVLLMLIWR